MNTGDGRVALGRDEKSKKKKRKGKRLRRRKRRRRRKKVKLNFLVMDCITKCFYI